MSRGYDVGYLNPYNAMKLYVYLIQKAWLETLWNFQKYTF